MEKNIGEMILSHYEKFLGNYTDSEPYKNEEGVSIQVLEYENIMVL